MGKNTSLAETSVKIFLCVSVACIIGASPIRPASADTFILNDGRKIEGIVIDENADRYNVKIKIGTIRIGKDTVKEIRRLPPEENFLNLGNQLLASGKPGAAVEQYKKALQVNPDYQPAREAFIKAEKLKNDAEEKKKTLLEQSKREGLDKIKYDLGLTIDPSGGRMIITGVSGKAEAVGLKPGDQIVQVNDLKAEGKPIEDTIKYLARDESAVYIFTIQREYELERKKIDYQKRSLTGVGMFLDSSDNGFVINGILVGEPADIAGLKTKDKVISINGRLLSGMSIDEAAGLINGSESSKLKITIQRSMELERK